MMVINKPEILTDKTKASWYVFAAFTWLLISYHLIYRHYFPYDNDYMGGDYSLFLPMLMDNYFWFAKNGLFTPPWFTPAFCGGQVNFVDPQSLYYSIPQFLIFADIDPINAIYLSVLLFASFGFWGMYLLIKRVFDLGTIPATLCGTLFMYNGFFANRMIVGHITYQGFMLIPVIAYLLLKTTTNKNEKINDAIGAGILLGYWMLSGMAIIVVPCFLSILSIAFIGFIYNRANWLNFTTNLVGAGIISIAISFSKLVGSIQLLSTFPRTDYPLPGIGNFYDIAKIITTSLFYSGYMASEIAEPLWKNAKLVVAPYEMAFGITIIPLMLMIIHILTFPLTKENTIKRKFILDRLKIIQIMLLMLLLCIPIAILFYNDAWNSFLKSLPIIGSTTSPQRWIIMYILPLIIFSGVAVSGFNATSKYITLALCLICVPIISVIDTKNDFLITINTTTQTTNSFINAKKDIKNHRIEKNISASESNWLGRNYLTISGINLINCANSTYGYFLENFSDKWLFSGNPLSTLYNNTLNIRNPACILYPKENECSLWDNFKSTQLAEATAFINYKPFSFQKSKMQKIADLISTASIWLIISYYAFIFTINLFKKRIFMSHRLFSKK